MTLIKGKPTHDVEWLGVKNFIDPDGTVTEIWKDSFGGLDISKGIIEITQTLPRTTMDWGLEELNEVLSKRKEEATVNVGIIDTKIIC